MKQQSNFQEIIANQEKILEKHSSSIQFSDSVKKYPIVINTPSGEEKVIYVSYDGRILDIVENDVIRIIKGDLIELVVGNRIQRTIGKSINVSDDYNVLSGSQVHLNPSEFRNYYNLDKIESDLLSEESEKEILLKVNTIEDLWALAHMKSQE